MATFRVASSFWLSSKNLVVLAGKIEDGSIKSGMRLCAEEHPGLKINLRIDGIEFVDFADGEALVGLTFAFENEKAARYLLDRNLHDRVFQVVESAL